MVAMQISHRVAIHNISMALMNKLSPAWSRAIGLLLSRLTKHDVIPQTSAIQIRDGKRKN
jgi:hypothetical protein